jgi:glycosyltransferase involved in cell wall biosynthesis
VACYRQDLLTNEKPAMSDKPLVSVVVIFLNAADFIEEAIESVIAQTFADWELLLVDDGSTDASTDIARGYAARLPARVSYLTHDDHENRGMSASRNLGIRHARADYIAFLDADDVWLPHKLEQQVAILEANPRAGMVVGATHYWCGWTGRKQDARFDHVAPVGGPQDALVEPPKLAKLLRPLGNEGSPSSSSMILRRASIERVGGFEEEFRGLFEDQAFLIKIYLTTMVFVSSACWDRYRQHPDSCCEQAKARAVYSTAHQAFLHWLEGYLRQERLDSTPVWFALQRALLKYRHPARYWLRECRVHPGQVAFKCAARWLRRILPRHAYHSLRVSLAASREALARLSSRQGGDIGDGSNAGAEEFRSR